MDELIELSVEDQIKQQSDKNNRELITKAAAIEEMKKWFYETFDDDLLADMQKHGIIAQAEGFSLSAIADIEVCIESIKCSS